MIQTITWMLSHGHQVGVEYRVLYHGWVTVDHHGDRVQAARVHGGDDRGVEGTRALHDERAGRRQYEHDERLVQ